MARKPCPCASCGKMIGSGGSGSLPDGLRTCRDCRRARREAGLSPPGRPDRPGCTQCGSPTPRGRVTCSANCATESQRHGGVSRVRICEICGDPYRATYTQQRTCGRACGVVLQRKNAPPTLVQIPQQPVTILSLLTCRACQAIYLGDWQAWCSESCRIQGYRERKREQDRAYNATRECAKWDRSPRACSHCRASFDPTAIGQTYCSSECMKRARRKRERANGLRDHGKNHRKRVRRHGGHYEPVRPETIFQRDGWKCQICGKKVRRDKKGPHPLSASIDHIIPVSEGGDHVAENLRTAHFICNSVRGTGKDEAVQLVLL